MFYEVGTGAGKASGRRGVLWSFPSMRIATARSSLLLVVGVCAAASGCIRMATEEDDLAQVGLRDASSEPPPGLLRPVAPDDAIAVHDRGRLLHQLEKALRMGYADGMMTVGDPGSDAVLPIVDVDPGGRSAQALFVRWRPGQLSVDNQRRRKINMMFVPVTAPMRADPRFLPLMREIGLVRYWERMRVVPDFLAKPGT